MAVTAAGELQGSIGGGRLEAEILSRRDQFLSEENARILSFHLSEADAADLDMICGGNVSVLVEAISPKNFQLVELFSRISESVRTQGCGWLISEFVQAEDQVCAVNKTFVDLQGKMAGNLPLHATIQGQQLLSVQRVDHEAVLFFGKNINHEAHAYQFGSNQLFVQPIGQFSKLFLIGAGHIAQKLAALTRGVGFFTVVMDDREEFLSQERFPQADQRLLLSGFENVFEQVSIDSNSYVVIVTRGHSSDKLVLQQALQTEAGYIGMIGSRRKINTTFELLRREGVSEETLQRVHSPIGLSIGAETPEEIAISIVAELIQERSHMKELKN